MLLVIHNLPNSTRYGDVKALIQSKCGLTELILDNLTSEGPHKRVTVGLTDEGDGAILVRKINGLYVEGKQLYVEVVRKKRDSEQPYRSTQNSLPQDSYDDLSMNETPRAKTPEVTPAYQNQDAMNMSMMYNMAAMTGMYYMPNVQAVQAMPLAQNTYNMGYGDQQQQVMPLMPQVTETSAILNQPFGFNDRDGDNTIDWGYNNNRQSDRSRMPYEERRLQSPPRERSDVQDRRRSRWDENKPKARESRRRSRSPQRGWNSRDRPDNRQNRFDNYRDSLAPAARDSKPQSYEPQNYDRAPRNMDYSASNFGDRNMDCSISNFGAPRNKNPSNSNFEASRSTNFSAANFHSRESYIEETPNAYGINAMQPSWDQSAYDQSQFGSDPFQRGGRGVPNQRNGNNTPSREMSRPYYESREISKPFEPRGSNNRNGPGPSRQFDDRRDEPRGPVKRGISKWDSGAGQPQAKKFAAPMAPRPQRPPFGKVGPKVPNMPNPRVRQPEPAQFQKLSYQQRLNKIETWRGQAASCIAKDMGDTLDVELPLNHKLFSHLKRCIRARIDDMMKNRNKDRLKIMEMYASKFPRHGNQEFFLYVVNDLKQKEATEKAQEDSAASGAVAPEMTVKPDKSVKPVLTGPAKLQAPTAKMALKPGAPPATTTKPTNAAKKAASKQAKPSGAMLASCPDGDKVSYKKIKAEGKRNWHEEKYELPEDMKKALDAEVDTMCDIFMSECMNPANDEEKPVCEQIADIVSDEFRKVVRLQTSKRLLNDTSNLIVRVHCGSRMPPTHELESFLLQYGCVALRKSDRKPNLKLAHMDSFENLDKLITLGSADIGGVTILFKAFQVCGPPPSAKELRVLHHKERLRRFHQAQLDTSDENILQPGYVYDPKASKSGNITTDTTNNEKQNTNGEPNVKDETELETEICEDVETEEYFNEEDKTELGIDTEVNEDIERGENDEDGDDENPVDTEGFPDNADDIDDENIDEDDLEDY